MASILEKLDLGKKQDKQIAIEFSNKIGEILSFQKESDNVIIKTVDLMLKDIKDQKFRIIIENQLLEDYPTIKWLFKK